MRPLEDERLEIARPQPGPRRQTNGPERDLGTSLSLLSRSAFHVWSLRAIYTEDKVVLCQVFINSGIRIDLFHKDVEFFISYHIMSCHFPYFLDF